jgi:serine/threonine protein phosphatase 1
VGGYATVTSYKEAKIPQDHLDWLLSLPTYLDLGDIWLAHAGVDPRMPLEKQTADQFCWVRDELQYPQPYFPNKLIIVGHTITFTLPGVNPGKLAQGQGGSTSILALITRKWLVDGTRHHKSPCLSG